MDGFAVQTRESDDAAIVSMSGEIDVYSVPAMRDAVLATIAGLDHKTRVVLDLREVRFIDSTGLALLVSARRHVTGRGGLLVLRDPSEWVIKVLEIAGLLRLFEIERSR